jgi:hypothetical protein
VSELGLFLFGTLVFFMVSCAALGPFLYLAWQAEDDWLKRKKKQREISPPPRNLRRSLSRFVVAMIACSDASSVCQNCGATEETTSP